MFAAVILLAICVIILGANTAKPINYVIVLLAVLALLAALAFPGFLPPWGR